MNNDHNINKISSQYLLLYLIWSCPVSGRPSALAPPTFESLLYVPAELVGEYRGQEYTNDGAVETTEHAKHFQEEKPNGNSRFLHGKKYQSDRIFHELPWKDHAIHVYMIIHT